MGENEEQKMATPAITEPAMQVIRVPALKRRLETYCFCGFSSQFASKQVGNINMKCYLLTPWAAKGPVNKMTPAKMEPTNEAEPDPA